MIIENQFTNYEISKSLKELGFKEACFAKYANRNEPKLEGSDLLRTDWDTVHVNHVTGNSVSAPMWQQVIDWFRKDHNIHIIPKKISDGYTWEVHYNDEINFVTHTNIYEEAREYSIIKALEKLYQWKLKKA